MGRRKKKHIDYLDTKVDESKVKDSIEFNLIFKICFPLQFLYIWFYPLIFKGYRKILTMEDLPRLHKSYNSDYYIKKFNRVWKFFDIPIIRRIRLILTVYICFGFPYIIAGFFQIVYTCLIIFYPKVLQLLLLSFNEKMSDEESRRFEEAKRILPEQLHELRPPEDITKVGFRENDWEGWVWLGILVLSIAFAAVFHQFCIFLSAKVGLKIRSVLTAKIYHKTLLLSNKARTQHEDGKILNYISTDCSKLDHYHQHFHDSWSCFVIVICSFYFIVELIGYGVLASIGMTLFLVPGCIILGLAFWRLRKTHLYTTDKRLSRMNEVFQGIKIIKCFTWESSYLNIINKVRNKEIRIIRLAFMFATSLKCVILCIPNMMTAAGFFTYYLWKNELDGVTIFTTIVYFNVIRTPLINLPVVLTRFLEGFISYNRLQNFLDAEERAPREDFEDMEAPIKIVDGWFEWEESKKKKKQRKKEESETDAEKSEKGEETEEEEMKKKKKRKKKRKRKKRKKLEEEDEEEDDDDFDDTTDYEIRYNIGKLCDINLEIKKGELVMVVGEVGSGKSSLLNAILGEMKRSSGTVELSGVICYCDQTPFILNGTMRDNILFGELYNNELFEKVLDVCRLQKDLDEDYFEGGEMVEIGEKGVNLSGGQKYRVSLARACYFGGDLYLFDDPLAAVDSACGKHIFRECIEDFLEGKTRVMITHQLNYCQKADRILYMRDGRIEENGTYDDLMDADGDFSKLVNEYFEEGETTSTVSTMSNINELLFDSDETNSSEDDDYKAGEEEIVIGEEDDSATGEIGIQTDHVELRELFLLGEEEGGKKKKKKITNLISQEERIVGSLPLKVVWDYLSAMPGGIWIFLVICCCYVFTEICFLGADVFLVQFSAQDTYPVQSVGIPMMTNLSTIGNLSQVFLYPCIPGPFIECWYRYLKIDWLRKAATINTQTQSVEYTTIDSRQNVVLLGIYGGFSILIIIALFAVSILTLNLLLSSSASIFRKVVKKLIFATVGFFDSQPIGRIISRLSGDVQLLDLELNFCIDVFLALFAAVVGACGMITFITKGMFFPPILFIAIIYFFVFQFYRRTSREVKRLNSVSKSPLLSSVSETLTGLSTIRAYGLESFFRAKNHRHIDLFNRSQYLLFTANRWLEVTLNIIGSWIIGAAGICALLIAYVDFFEPIRGSPSFLSLGVTDAIIISTLLSSIVFVLTNIEVQMNAVERLGHYVHHVPQEGGKKKKKKKNRDDSCSSSSSSSSDSSKSSDSDDNDDEKEIKLDFNTKERLNWIKYGRVEFSKFYMKYREDTRTVLRGVDFVIHPKERIGIIGDTGSGKTSLMNSILRFVESSKGCILIDGMDISEIPLLVLRREISIIPQEPVLFKGTIRSNLDPFNSYKDEEILRALDKSNLRALVRVKLRKGLKSRVEEGGRNFSVGERQLFCMARAILKKTRILIMDECTASVDYETDQFIQRTIREEFSKNCTVLTIAHRLQTILDYDRILVMNSGKVAEFDTPYKLIRKKDRSHFYNLLMENPNPQALLSQILDHGNRREPKRRFVDWERVGAEIYGDIEEYKKRNAKKKNWWISCLGLE